MFARDVVRVLLAGVMVGGALLIAAGCTRKPAENASDASADQPAASAPATTQEPSVTEQSPTPATGRIADLIGTEWKLESFDADSPVPAAIGITFSASGARIGGHGGCNRYMGSINDGAAPGEVSVGPLALTKMACGPEANDAETRYTNALQQAKSFRIQDGKLLIEYRDGEVTRTLTYARVSASAVVVPLSLQR